MAPITQEPTIAIEPADPGQVYVPYYDPATAYGAWPYPNYQPYAFPPPIGYGIVAGLATGLAFGAGVAVTSSLWGWGRPNWGGGSISINSNQFNRINANRNVIAGNTWQHNAVHRQGVAYRDASTSQRFGRATTGAAARRDYRGYAGQGAGAAAGRAGGLANAAAAHPGAQARVATARPAAQNRVAAARPAAQNRVAAAHPGGQGFAARPGAQPGRQALAQHPNFAASHGAGSGGFAAQRSAFNPGNGAQARAFSQRGAASRQQFAGRAQGGGFQRAGGGGGFHGGGGGGGFHGGGGRGGGGGFHGRR
jgi:Protein of unknown function (DUF3300)